VDERINHRPDCLQLDLFQRSAYHPGAAELLNHARLTPAVDVASACSLTLQPLTTGNAYD